MKKLMVGVLCFFSAVSCILSEEVNPEKFSQEAKEILQKKYPSKEETMRYLKSLGPEKLYLLAIEADKKDPEAAGWILAYGGLSDWKDDQQVFLVNYLYLNKYKKYFSERLKTWIQESVVGYIKDLEETGGMNFVQEKNVMNEGMKFMNDSKFSSRDKNIITQFFWDVWSGFFPRVEKMEKKAEVYEEMNRQAILIAETLQVQGKLPELSAASNVVLRKFIGHYAQPELPDEFKKTPSFGTTAVFFGKVLQ
jgi:hypothetical protein